MGAFIIAGIIAALTIGWCLLELFASGMSDSPSASSEMAASVPWHFAIGMIAAGLIAGSHFIHIGW